MALNKYKIVNCKPTNGTLNVCTNTVLNPFMPTGAFNICCPRDCVSRHNGGTAGAPLKPLRDDNALRALSSLRGLSGAFSWASIMPRDASVSFLSPVLSRYA